MRRVRRSRDGGAGGCAPPGPLRAGSTLGRWSARAPSGSPAQGETPSARGDSGFTLLELLLAASITTLIVTAGFVLYSASTRFQARQREQEERRMIAESICRRLGEDVRQAWPMPSPIAEQATLPVFVGSAESARWWTLTGRTAGPDLVEVEWSLDEEGALHRRANALRTYAGNNPDGRFEDEVVAEGVAGISFLYYTDQGRADRHEGSPPREVEVEIAWEDGVSSWKFATLMPVPALPSVE